MAIDNRELLAALERIRVEWHNFAVACDDLIEVETERRLKAESERKEEAKRAMVRAMEALSSVERAEVFGDLDDVLKEAERRIRSEDETEVEPVQ